MSVKNGLTLNALSVKPAERERGTMKATKASLSRALKKAAGTSYREAAFCVDFLVETLAAEIARGGGAELRGLGSFRVTRTKARSCPSSLSENKVIPAHGKVTFRPSEALRRAVWDRGPKPEAKA